MKMKLKRLLDDHDLLEFWEERFDLLTSKDVVRVLDKRRTTLRRRGSLTKQESAFCVLWERIKHDWRPKASN